MKTTHILLLGGVAVAGFLVFRKLTQPSAALAPAALQSATATRAKVCPPSLRTKTIFNHPQGTGPNKAFQVAACVDPCTNKEVAMIHCQKGTAATVKPSATVQQASATATRVGESIGTAIKNLFS